jgi:iron complex outermembrane receptor protein
MVSSCRKSRWPVSLMVLMASTCLAGIAIAQDSGTSSPPVLAQAQESMVFDIPAQPLAGAVTAFGRQSGFQVSVDQATLANLRSAAVSGRMTPEDALRQMLAGTGVTWRFAGGRSIYLTRLADGQQSGTLQLDPVQVQGFPVPQQAMIDNLPAPYAGGQVATGGQLGLLGNRDVMDTPFNQSNYTSKKAQEQQAKTMRDVLIDDPSVRSYWPDGGSTADAMYIRGFNVFSGDAAYGGMYGILPYSSVMVEMAERVELLKGPTAMLNGMAPTGSLGGTINIVPKRAANEPLTQITANYASSAQFGGHADIARRFGDDKQFGVRFNGVFKAGQTAVDTNSDQRGLGLLGLDFRGDRVRLSAGPRLPVPVHRRPDRIPGRRSWRAAAVGAERAREPGPTLGISVPQGSLRRRESGVRCHRSDHRLCLGRRPRPSHRGALQRQHHRKQLQRHRDVLGADEP